MLVCLFGCDALYERGFISVRDGNIVISRNLASLHKAQVLLKRFNGRRCAAYDDRSARYFRWHYERRFGG
jgi:hypothetical protein